MRIQYRCNVLVFLYHRTSKVTVYRAFAKKKLHTNLIFRENEIELFILSEQMIYNSKNILQTNIGVSKTESSNTYYIGWMLLFNFCENPISPTYFLDSIGFNSATLQLNFEFISCVCIAWAFYADFVFHCLEIKIFAAYTCLWVFVYMCVRARPPVNTHERIHC